MATGEVLTGFKTEGSKVEAVHEKVVEMTRQLFGGDVAIRLEPDPEVPISYFVVYADARGEVDELSKLDHQWHRVLGETAGPDAERYCLSLVLK